MGSITKSGRAATSRELPADRSHSRGNLLGVGFYAVVFDDSVLMADPERVEKRRHHSPLLGQMIDDQRPRRQRFRERRHAGQMFGFSVDVKRQDKLGTKLSLLGDEQHRLDLVVGRLLVEPESARGVEALSGGHLFPESGGRQGRFGHNR